MRKIVFVLSLMVAVLLSACGRDGDATTLSHIELEPAHEVANTQEPASNPFAAALLEYFAGGVDEDFSAQISRKAFWADITYSGDQGVVAIRHIPLNEPWYISGILQPTNVLTQARIFYFTSNQLIYKDVEDFREARVVITPSGRAIINSTRDIGDWQFTVLDGATDLVNHTDVLIYRFTVYREFQENGRYNYYIFQGGWSEGLEGGRTPITEEEFNTINAEYGLTDWIGWRLMRDETEQILAYSLE